MISSLISAKVVGEGEVIESTPAWKGCVQKTLLPSRNSSNYEKLPVRKWDLHGKSEYIDYTSLPSQELMQLREQLKAAKADIMNRDETIKMLRVQINSLQTVINNVRKIVKE